MMLFWCCYCHYNLDNIALGKQKQYKTTSKIRLQMIGSWIWPNEGCIYAQDIFYIYVLNSNYLDLYKTLICLSIKYSGSLKFNLLHRAGQLMLFIWSGLSSFRARQYCIRKIKTPNSHNRKNRNSDNSLARTSRMWSYGSCLYT